MTLVVTLTKAVASYFVLMFIVTNLLGMVVRGFFLREEMEGLIRSGRVFSKQEAAQYLRRSDFMTVIFGVLLLIFFYFLIRYLLLNYAIAAAMLMVGRLPDLIWEIRYGEKIDSVNHPKGAIGVLCTLLLWGALPVLFLAFSNF